LRVSSVHFLTVNTSEMSLFSVISPIELDKLRRSIARIDNQEFVALCQ